MKSLYYSYNMFTDKAYIIRIKGNEISETLASRCAESCSQVNMKYEYWDAFDGTNESVIPPANIHPFMKMLKINDHYLINSEVACALSHISLWVKCVEQDQPLVVLEHDAIMIANYPEHSLYNSICYLGCYEQFMHGWKVAPSPPSASEGPNDRFILRAHAYSIDPAVAKNMLAYVLKYGIFQPLDRMLRVDVFSIHQIDIYAYDNRGQTTIKSNSKIKSVDGHRPNVRNDRLEF